MTTIDEHHEHHIVSPRVYLLIFGTLLLCTGLTVWAAFTEMGWLNPVVAIAIACFKATLVVLYFMHIRYSSTLMKLTVCAGVFTFLVLITMTMSDYISRAWGMW